MSPDVPSRLRDADPCPSPVAYDDGLVQRNIEAITRADLTVGGPAFPPPPHRPSRLAVAALVAALVVVGSIVGVEVARDGGSSPSVANGPNDVAMSSAVAPAPTATGPAPGPAGTQPPPMSFTATFSANGISFEYPARWTSYPFEMVSSFTNLLTYLSTTPLAQPCVTSSPGGGAATTCTPPKPDLARGGVLIDWTARSFPGRSLSDEPGEATTLAGQPAKVDRTDIAALCVGTGAVRSIQAAVAWPVGGSNLISMTACIGDGVEIDADLAAVDQMLASLRIDP